MMKLGQKTRIHSIKQKECEECGCELIYKNELDVNLCTFHIQQEMERDNQRITVNAFEHILQTTHLDNPTIICLLRIFIANNCHYEDINDLIQQIDKEDF